MLNRSSQHDLHGHRIQIMAFEFSPHDAIIDFHKEIIFDLV